MKRFNIFAIVLISGIVLSYNVTLSAQTSLPYLCSFENPSDTIGWHMIAPSNPQVGFFIGNAAAYVGNHSMYVSADSGVTAGYVKADQSYRTVAYRSFSLPAGTYNLSFKYRVAGSPDSFDALWFAESSSNISQFNSRFAVNNASTISSWMLDYYFSNKVVLANNVSNYNEWLEDYSIWKTASARVTVLQNSTYRLAFSWYVSKTGNVHNPGLIIDQICIDTVDSSTRDCAAEPLALSHHRSGNDAIFTWAGNAAEYQVRYFINDQPQIAVVQNIITTSYSIDCSTIEDGAYTFQVRSICGLDTSRWVGLDYVLMYDISEHCIDYLNFSDPNVHPSYGTFTNPTSTAKVKDDGYHASSSRHTVHYLPHETDPRTGNQLTTVPDGQAASVRLGNWEKNAQGEALTYVMPITQSDAVLQMRYAIVMQDPVHPRTNQPRFTLELLDSVGTLIDSCASADFMADRNAVGWNTYQNPNASDTTTVTWKDWTLVAMNMTPYIGQTLQIRLTNKDCKEGAHFGYSYFTLSCSEDLIKKIHCGIKPDTLSAIGGFYYRWYRTYDPSKTVLGRDMNFPLTNPMDTCTYSVDLMQLTDTNCYYTLNISSLAHLPVAQGLAKHTPSGCNNYVQFIDSSYISGFYWDEQGNKQEVTRLLGCDSYLWDFGPYGTSTEQSPKLVVPDEGDTLHITLYAYMDNGACASDYSFDFVVPSIGQRSSVERHYMCAGDTVSLYGVTYTGPAIVTDTLHTWTGCDSLSSVEMLYFRADTIHYYDTICESNPPSLWRGQLIDHNGEYYDHISSLVYACDSLVDVMHVVENPLFVMTIDPAPLYSFCSGAGVLEIPFSVTAGHATTYDILFDAKGHTAGLVDRYDEVISTDGMVQILMSEPAWAGQYDATITFHNSFCDIYSSALHVQVNYPDTILTQRWNDFLSVRKTAYDLYGGFYDYQWYKDGQPMTGQTGTQLYLPEEGLDMDAGYSVELTRSADGVRVRSCEFYPTQQPGTVTLKVTPTSFSASQLLPMTVFSDESATVSVFNQSGYAIQSRRIEAGYTQLDSPTSQGVFLVYVTTDSGRMFVQKIIVK